MTSFFLSFSLSVFGVGDDTGVDGVESDSSVLLLLLLLLVGAEGVRVGVEFVLGGGLGVDGGENILDFDEDVDVWGDGDGDPIIYLFLYWLIVDIFDL